MQQLNQKTNTSMNIYMILINTSRENIVLFDDIHHFHICAPTRKDAIQKYIATHDFNIVNFMDNLRDNKNQLNFSFNETKNAYYEKILPIMEFFDDISDHDHNNLFCDKKKNVIKKFINKYYDQIFYILDIHSKHEHNIIIKKIKA